MVDIAPIVVRHGDSWTSSPWAVLNTGGTALTLTGWDVRAQLRRAPDDPVPLWTFTRARGVIVSTAAVKVGTSTVTTATVSLTLTPADFASLPPNWTGVLDIEISSDLTASPLRRHTVALCGFTIVADVTRPPSPGAGS